MIEYWHKQWLPIQIHTDLCTRHLVTLTNYKHNANLQLLSLKMLSMNYFLLPDTERDIIVHGPTNLRLNVYNLENEDFRPTQGELHIFGDDHGEWLAFGTEGWSGGDRQVLSNALLR